MESEKTPPESLQPENASFAVVVPNQRKRSRRGKTKFNHRKLGTKGGRPRWISQTEFIPAEDTSSQASTGDETCNPAKTDTDLVITFADEFQSPTGSDIFEAEKTRLPQVDCEHNLSATHQTHLVTESVTTEELESIIVPENEAGTGNTLCTVDELHHAARSEILDEDNTTVVSAVAAEISIACSGPAEESIAAEENATLINEIKPSQQLVERVFNELRNQLPFPWVPLIEENGFNVLMVSRDEERSTQRRAFFSFSGEERLTVHRRPIEREIADDILDCTEDRRTSLTEQERSSFVNRIVSVINKFRTYTVCMAIEAAEFKRLIDIDKSGKLEEDVFGEGGFSETFRPYECQLLVSSIPKFKQRCTVCVRKNIKFKARMSNHMTDLAAPCTPNICLDRDQLIAKVERQGNDLRYARAQIKTLKAKLQEAFATNSVCINEGLADDLASVFDESNLSPIQTFFVQEQLKAAKAKTASGRRWHPTLIRFALLLKTTSSACYHAIQQSGAIILPSERTLYDYSHFITPTEGCSIDKLNRVCKLLADKYKESYQQYHVLLMDEMHINQKLVYQKSSGQMVGYVNLTEAEKELAALEAQIKGEDCVKDPPMATKVLTFMVRGVASGVKEVVGSYTTTNDFDHEELYERAWEVICSLEESGIKIIAITADGAAVNRAFFACHAPLTKTAGINFDTKNLCAPYRPLFFFSDPPHLLKTIRNCFYKSGTGKGCSRLLTKNKEVIVWSTIRKLFEEDKKHTVRRCYKLNTQNVYLNSYSAMSVDYAAKIMSNAVAKDLKSRNWPGTSETVSFIQQVNDFFDMLNGHGVQGTVAPYQRKANKNLEPYVSLTDERFDKLLQFVKYLDDWSAEVEAKQGFTKSEKNKMVLSQETIKGIKMTVHSFIGATKYLLEEGGVHYLYARVFCQDPLERYFGKQRQSCGGNRNPTANQFLSNEQKIALHRDVNVKKGNVLGKKRCMEVSNDPLPKRKRTTSYPTR